MVNPAAGRRRGERVGAQVRAALSAAGQVTDLTGRSLADAWGRAHEAVATGAVDALVVVGGDGMAHLGINAVAGTRVPLGIVPAGTGNDIARELGLPTSDVDEAIARCLHGRPRGMDAVRAVAADGRERWFGGVLAAGFDAVVNERANGWRRPRGRARYTLAVLRELPVFRPVPYVITLDGTRLERRAMLVAVGNGPAYGGGMRVLPPAEVDDGLLDVLVVHELSTTAFLRVFPRVFAGRHVGHPAVELLRGRSVRVETSGIVGYADGERIGPLPMTCSVVPQAVSLLC